MAVTPTGDIYKALSFDNVSSRTYGVYITGSAVYNAPEREVEMISIPGRNGQFALDKGRFENIEVTYPAGIFADNETDFADAISEFRNFLCSRKGYVRLQDEYNPNEYRMAIYKSGLEVEPAQLKAGEFEITFDCKPQRFLTSGETAVTVSSGDTLTNPTLFESSPLLEVYGYGTLLVNNYPISIQNEVIGMMSLSAGIRATQIASLDYSNAPLEYGDDVYVREAKAQIDYYASNLYRITNMTVAKTGSGMDFDFDYSLYDDDHCALITFSKDSLTYKNQYVTNYVTIYTITIDLYDIVYGTTPTETINVRVQREGRRGSLYFGFETAPTIAATRKGRIKGTSISTGLIEADSTAMAFGNPTYIDCDLGEAYGITDGDMTSLNRYIDLGSSLPVLAVGSSEITYDNTITEVKVTPRWWKV